MGYKILAATSQKIKFIFPTEMGTLKLFKEIFGTGCEKRKEE
jgi:hypothetical protein